MTETYEIRIGERWSLEDLYTFSKAYEQVYFLTFSLLPDLPDHAVERISHAYTAFPWQGGYSAVNFYNQLKYVVPPSDRPRINSMRYASPGVIELVLLVFVAKAISNIVKQVAGSIREMNATYNEVMTDLQKRKLLRLQVRQLELEVASDELEAIEHHADTMARMLGFGDHKALTARTGHPFITLKILLSFYRRLRKLAEFKNNGKADP